MISAMGHIDVSGVREHIMEQPYGGTSKTLKVSGGRPRMRFENKKRVNIRELDEHVRFHETFCETSGRKTKYGKRTQISSNRPALQRPMVQRR